MPTYGKVGEFQESEETWTQYVERLEQYFEANEIEEASKRRAIFLSVCGRKTYALLRDLLQPKKPKDVELKDIFTELEKHYLPKPSVIVERFKFHSKVRGEGESVATFVAGLRKMTEHCEFGDSLEDMIRDRFVCGINDDKIQRRLLAEPELKYKRAVELALAMEMALKNVIDITAQTAPTSSGENIHKLNNEKATGSECSRCGGKHDSTSCKFKDSTCFKCQKKGHLASKCFSKKKANQARSSPTGSRGQTHKIAEDLVENVYEMYRMTGEKVESFKVEIELCSKKQTMEIDTGASKTILNERTYNELRNDLDIEKTTAILSTYTGERIPVKGKVRVPVKYGDQHYQLDALVVEGKGPNLLGRDWISEIKLDWSKVFKVTHQDPLLHQVLDKNKDVFKEELGTLKGTTAKIYVDPNAQPKFLKARPVPYALKVNVEHELNRLEREGIISPVEFSEWASPIVPVVKSNGAVRICGDYKSTVNGVSKLDNYPIPKTEDLLATLGGGQKFTKLDMSQAYQQLVLDEESRKYTTINTHKGLYEYTRLPFGVSSAPGIFQRTIENLLKGIDHVVVRMDDILISGKDDSEHLNNLDAVLTKLCSAGLRLRLGKCLFMQPEVTYCGYVINGTGVKPVADKVEAIQNAPTPKNVTQLRAFLGMLNYYHRFLPDVATVLEPLHNLLRKEVPWQWKEQHQKAFEAAKQLLQSYDLLVHFDPNLKLILACDASDYGVGAVLSHCMPDGHERPISYVSRTLSDAERNYATIEKEALAVVFGVKKFHQFLYGHKFTIQTDHKPLEGLLHESKAVPPLAAARIQRWALTLATYEYEIQYKAGVNNENADALSRLPLPDTLQSTPTPGETILLLEHLEQTPVQTRHIREWTRRDPVLSQVLRFTLEGWPLTHEQEEFQPFIQRKVEISTEDGCLLWGSRVIVPPQGRKAVLEELHETHPGISRMKALARSYMWWPGMDKDLEKVVKDCHQCQIHQKSPAEAPLHPWEWPGNPWTRLHIDYAGPFLGHMFLVVIDACSKWLEVSIMKSTTSSVTIEKLREMFATHGLPETIVSDNGTNFTSCEFEEFMLRNGIKHIKVSPYHPASNGQAERAVRVFKEGITKMEGGSLQTRLSRFLLKYRVTPHTTTGSSPAELLMKRKLRTKLDLMRPSIVERVRRKQNQQKTQHDYHAKEREIQHSDPVYVKDFRKSKLTWMPGTITEKTGPISARVQLEDGSIVRRHQDHMAIRTDPTENDQMEPSIPEMFSPSQSTPVLSEHQSSGTTETVCRPTRSHRLPGHLKDYDLS